MNENRIGSYVGTGSAVNVSLGWTPAYLVIWNETDGDARWEWFNGMTAGHALQTAGAGTLSKITANGVTTYAGTTTAAPGFTAGSALSESGKTFRYHAVRNTNPA